METQLFSERTVATCSCVGLFDRQLFGSEACFCDGGTGRQTIWVKAAQKQSKAQHNHLQTDRVGRRNDKSCLIKTKKSTNKISN